MKRRDDEEEGKVDEVKEDEKGRYSLCYREMRKR